MRHLDKKMVSHLCSYKAFRSEVSCRNGFFMYVHPIRSFNSERTGRDYEQFTSKMSALYFSCNNNTRYCESRGTVQYGQSISFSVYIMAALREVFFWDTRPIKLHELTRPFEEGRNVIVVEKYKYLWCFRFVICVTETDLVKFL